MTTRQLRQRCETVADSVDVPVPFDVNALVHRLGQERRRPIHVLAMALPHGAPCGVCIATGVADYVVVSDAAVGTQRDQITLHELAHLLLGHTLVTLTEDEATRRILPHLDPAVVRGVMARTSYDTREEAEAELLASLLRQKAGLWRDPGGRPGSAAVERLGRCLEHGRE